MTHPRPMTPAQFRRALRRLDLTQEQAAEELGVASAGRVNDWAQGRRAVPPYIQKFLELMVRCQEADP